MRLTRFLIPFVYFIAGATTLAGVATTFYYKDDLRLSIVQVQLLGSISVIPWSIKPLYGLASDLLPIAGMRRKPYLFLAGLLGSLGYLSLATWVSSFAGAFAAALTSAAGFAMADVLVDGIVAEQSRTQAEAGRLQSICRAALLLGALVVAYLSGVLVEAIGARRVFLLTATLPLFTSLFAVFLTEARAGAVRFSVRTTWRNIRGALTPGLLWAVAFLFVWRSTPTSGGAFSYFLIDELHFTPEFFGRLSLISNVAGIAGVLVFRKFLLRLPLKTLFLWVMILSVVLSLPAIGLIEGWYETLGVSPQAFAIADTLITGPLTEIGFLPLLVLTARICPKGLEATMFALLASIMNIGLAVSDMGGAMLTTIFDVHAATETLPANYANLNLVMWVAILSSFLPLPLLPFLPETRTIDEKMPENAGVMVSAVEPWQRVSPFDRAQDDTR